MAFFNFNIKNVEVINVQIDTLEHKFRKWRNNSDPLQAERKVRTYALEALVAFNNPAIKGARNFVNTHPAAETLVEMLNWLKDRGYKTTIRPAEGVVITSSRNTYVASPFDPVSAEIPKCVGLMNIILSPRNRK